MKDYYAILGVVPSAEDVVIRAAWKALAQRYHPDRFVGDIDEANKRMAEINEGYSVLSDPVQRKEYDKLRGNREGNFGDWIHEEEADQASNSSDPLEKDWAVAVRYYHDLFKINNRLSKISHKLAFSYRATLLERKVFEERVELAAKLENAFLQSYFGSNPVIVDFALQLILSGNNAAAKALNDAIRVLGLDLQEERVIRQICKDFNFVSQKMAEERLKTERARERTAAERSTNKTVTKAQEWPWLVGAVALSMLIVLALNWF
jgi:curved DNA-binding protein CbpA